MSQNKQNIVKNQLIFIAITGIMAMISLISAVISEEIILSRISWVCFVLLTLLCLLLVWGLKGAMRVQVKLDSGDYKDKEVQKLLKTPVYDERQQHFVLKSYQYGFWFMVLISWIGSIVTRFSSIEISSSFWFNLILFGGTAVNVTFSNLNGASPFVDSRFGKFGHLMGLPIAIFGLFICAITITACVVTPLGWTEFFSQGGTGSMLILGLSLFATGSSIAYHHYLNKREEED